MCERPRMPRDRLKRAVLGPVVAACFVCTACSDDGKSSTEPQRLPDAAAFIPSAPAPQPTPTPTATPDDGTIPAFPGGGNSSGTCGEPVPPPVSRINVKVHGHQTDR